MATNLNKQEHTLSLPLCLVTQQVFALAELNVVEITALYFRKEEHHSILVELSRLSCSNRTVISSLGVQWDLPNL